MKYYVIDTHIFLWLLFEPEKVNEAQLAILKSAKNRVYITNISFWEIALKCRLGKLKLNNLTPDDLPPLAEKMGLEVLNVCHDVMASFYKLPQVDSHKDPFDRMIIWQCICDKAVLVSNDRKFPEYEALGLSVL